MRPLYSVLYFMIGSFAFPSEITSFRIDNYHYNTIEESPFVALVIVRGSENCGIGEKYCGATILSEYWVLSSAECFDSMYQDDDDKIDCVCPEYISIATKVDAVPPDTEIERHEIEQVRLANNSISVDAERMVLIKLKNPINFDETQEPVRLGRPTDKPNDSDFVDVVGFKFNNKNETENLGNTSMSITNSCYKRFPEFVNDCFCTTDYNYKGYSNGSISHFLPGTSIIFNKSLVGFDSNSVTVADDNNNDTYVIFMNVVKMYDWIMEIIKN